MPADEFVALNPADAIIARFGGTRAMAAKLGIPPSTVQSWKEAGLIPAKRQRHVIAEARLCGIDVIPSDFIEIRDVAGGANTEAAA